MGFAAVQVTDGATLLSELGIDVSKNWQANQIKNLANPTDAQDAATLASIGTITGDYLPLAGGTMAGEIDMGGNKIPHLGDPVDDEDAANKKYVDANPSKEIPFLNVLYCFIDGPGDLGRSIEVEYTNSYSYPIHVMIKVQIANETEDPQRVGVGIVAKDSAYSYDIYMTDALAPGSYLNFVMRATIAPGETYKLTNDNELLSVVIGEWEELVPMLIINNFSDTSHQTVNDPGSFPVQRGTDKTYTTTPDEGYHVIACWVDEVDQGAISEYTFEDVQVNHSIMFEVEED